MTSDPQSYSNELNENPTYFPIILVKNSKAQTLEFSEKTRARKCSRSFWSILEHLKYGTISSKNMKGNLVFFDSTKGIFTSHPPTSPYPALLANVYLPPAHMPGAHDWSSPQEAHRQHLGHQVHPGIRESFLLCLCFTALLMFFVGLTGVKCFQGNPEDRMDSY